MHDVNGVELKVGDRVLVECEVMTVGQDDGDCNVTLLTVGTMPPRKNEDGTDRDPGPRRSQLMLSTRQVVAAPTAED